MKIKNTINKAFLFLRGATLAECFFYPTLATLVVFIVGTIITSFFSFAPYIEDGQIIAALYSFLSILFSPFYTIVEYMLSQYIGGINDSRPLVHSTDEFLDLTLFRALFFWLSYVTVFLFFTKNTKKWQAFVLLFVFFISFIKMYIYFRTH